MTVLIALAAAVLAGCSAESSKPRTSESMSEPIAVSATPAPQASATESEPTPRPQKTYIPAWGDPKTHDFTVTIHDVLPLDAYRVAGGQCVSTAYPGGPHQLVFSGPSRHLEDRPLDKSFPMPVTAQLYADGTCVSKLEVTVPYKPRYTAGIAMEGRGIALPTAPKNEPIITQGDSQEITVLK